MANKRGLAKLIIQNMIDHGMVVADLKDAFIIDISFWDREAAEDTFEEIAEEIMKYLGVS